MDPLVMDAFCGEIEKRANVLTSALGRVARGAQTAAHGARRVARAGGQTAQTAAHGARRTSATVGAIPQAVPRVPGPTAVGHAAPASRVPTPAARPRATGSRPSAKAAPAAVPTPAAPNGVAKAVRVPDAKWPTDPSMHIGAKKTPNPTSWSRPVPPPARAPAAPAARAATPLPATAPARPGAAAPAAAGRPSTAEFNSVLSGRAAPAPAAAAAPAAAKPSAAGNLLTNLGSAAGDTLNSVGGAQRNWGTRLRDSLIQRAVNNGATPEQAYRRAFQQMGAGAVGLGGTALVGAGALGAGMASRRQ